MKCRRGDAVLVKWQDHYSRNNGWQAISSVGKYAKNSYYCYSTGVIVSIDKKQVVLAQNWHQPAGSDWEPHVSDFMVIMIKCIKETTLIKKKVLNV